ncbi:MAG: hypothetical protein AMXMBFR36_25860 [Acidobacteriota bacterium]
MNHEEVVERLPWLLNATLEGEELARVERHLETCAACRAERLRTEEAGRLFGLHPDAAELAGIAFGADPEGAAAVHLEVCAECREALALARAAAALEGEPDAPAAAPPQRARRTGRLAAAAAAALAAVALTWAVTATRQADRLEEALREQTRARAALDRELAAAGTEAGRARARAEASERELARAVGARALPGVVELLPLGEVVRGASRSDPPTAAPGAVLLLLATAPRSPAEARAVLTAADGGTVAIVEGLRLDAHGAYSLQLSSEGLAAGPLEIRLERAGEPAGRPFASYRLRVVEASAPAGGAAPDPPSAESR